MRCSSSNELAFLVAMLVPLVARVEESAPPVEPQVSEEREFEDPGLDAWDVVAAPFYLPERVVTMVLYPAGRLTGWAMEHRVPERVVDILSDDTKRIWVIPSADYSTTNGFSLGGTFRYDNIFYEGKDFSASGNIYTNLDRGFSASYSKSSSFIKPFSYGAALKYKLDTDSDFYGLGIDSSRRDKSIFTSENVSVSLKAGWTLRQLRFLTFGVRGGVEYTGTGRGRSNGSNRFVEETFPRETLTALGEQVFWFRYGLEFEFDSRIPRGHPHRGWLLYARADRYEDPRGDNSYLEARIVVSTLINLHNEENVLALSLSANAIEDFGDHVPFYRLSVLDKDSPLRGFSGGRFRDRRTALGNVEYRFKLWKSMRADPLLGLGTLFVDIGKPFDDFDSFARGGVLYSVGTGLLITTLNDLFIRAQVGYGGEGIEGVFSFSRAF